MLKCLASSFGSNRGLSDITVPLVLNYFALFFKVKFHVKAACKSCSLTMRGSVCGDISCCWSVLCNSVKGEHIAVESLQRVLAGQRGDPAGEC